MPATSRQRRTTVLGYTARRDRRPVAHRRSGLDPFGRFSESEGSAFGVYETCAELVAQHGVTKGRVRLTLAPGEHHAGLTVNEYETLLMRHDLREVLRDPLRFMAEKAGHILGNPRAIPAKTLDYAKYDLVRVFNKLVDSLGLRESMVESVLSRAIAMPAARFLRMKRSVSLLVSDRDVTGQGAIVEGTYQSPILVQWHRGGRPFAGARRHAHPVHLETFNSQLQLPTSNSQPPNWILGVGSWQLTPSVRAPPADGGANIASSIGTLTSIFSVYIANDWVIPPRGALFVDRCSGNFTPLTSL